MGFSNKLFCDTDIFSHCCNPQRFLQPEVLRLYFPCWTPGLCGLSHSPFVPPGLSTHKCGAAHSPSQHLFWSSSCLSQVLTTLAVCLSLLLIGVWMTISSFKSLVVRLPYSSIFWQFWLFFAFKLVIFLVVQGSKVYLPMPPSWLEVP